MGEDPIFQRIKPGTLDYSDEQNATEVRDCTWAIHTRLMSYVEILEQYGDMMTEKDKNLLNTQTSDTGNYSDSSNPLFRADSSLDRAEGFYDGIGNSTNKYTENIADKFHRINWRSGARIPVYEVEFKSPREVNVDKLLNEVSGLDNFELTDDTIIEGQKKSNKRYILDRYEGVRIGSGVYVNIGKSKYLHRSLHSFYKCNLSFNGLTYNGPERPVSMVESTKSYQILYNFTFAQIKNIMSRVGTKGLRLRLSQLPNFIQSKDKKGLQENIKLWSTYAKVGIMIDDDSNVTDGAPPAPITNPVYDLKMGEDLGPLFEILARIENNMERLIGSNRQSMGQVSPYDTKGGTQAAIAQSNLNQSSYYKIFDDVTSSAFFMIANELRVAYHKTGYNGSVYDDAHGQLLYKLGPEVDIFSYGVYVKNSYREEMMKNELKQLLLSLSSQGQGADLMSLIPVLFQDEFSMHEILRKFEQMSIQEKQSAMEQQQAQMQQEQQMFMQKIQLEHKKQIADIEKIYSDMRTQVEKLELEKYKIDTNAELKAQENLLKEKQIEAEAKEIDAIKGKTKEQNREVKNIV